MMRAIMPDLPARPRPCAARCALAALIAASAVALACAPAPGGAAPGGEIRVRWVLPEGFPAQVSLHRAPPGATLWQTRAFAEGPELAAGEEIPGGVLRVRLDEPQRVVVRLRNPLDRPVRFWVAPHLPQPYASDAALAVACLCTGETYEVPARGTWTRVIDLGIRRRGAVTPLAITHVVTMGDAPRLD